MVRRWRSGEVAQRETSKGCGGVGRKWGKRGRWHLLSGERLSLGRRGLARRLPCGGNPARAARRQDRIPGQVRTGNPPQRPRELASANHQRSRAPGRRRQAAALSVAGSPRWRLPGSGRSALPEPPARKDGCLPEPVKSAYGVPSGSATPPLDRTRPTGGHGVAAECPSSNVDSRAKKKLTCCSIIPARSRLRSSN